MENLLSKPVILASTSPRRKELLEQIGVSFSVVPSYGDESKITINEYPDPSILVMEKAKCKGSEVVERLLPKTIEIPNQLFCIISCDSIVVGYDNKNKPEIFEKPKSRNDCVRMMRSYSENSHFVYSAVVFTLIQNGKIIEKIQHLGQCEVFFGKINEEEIQKYADLKEPYDKAGGYGIQATAARWVTSVKGDYYSIVGLPVSKVAQVLNNHGLL